MKVYTEINLYDFNAWSGGRDTLNHLADWLTRDEFDSLEAQFEEVLGEEITDTQLNDFLWFETDTIASMLGYRDWEALEKAMEGEEEEDDEEDDDEADED